MNKKGFTLIELSIVLVIIGLLVGGVMGGQALVQQAKLQKLGTQLNQYKVAFDTFKMQYNAIPGDMPNASSFWPGARNGNGDGIITYSNNSTDNEDIHFWHHLSKSGIVNGNYSKGAASPTRYIPGLNCPETPLGGCSTSQTLTLYTRYNTYLIVGLIYTSSGHPRAAIMTPKDHFALNSKFDNGDPSSGNILAVKGFALDPNNVCIDQNALVDTNIASANYLLDDPTVSCRVFYRLD